MRRTPSTSSMRWTAPAARVRQATDCGRATTTNTLTGACRRTGTSGTSSNGAGKLQDARQRPAGHFGQHAAVAVRPDGSACNGLWLHEQQSGQGGIPLEAKQPEWNDVGGEHVRRGRAWRPDQRRRRGKLSGRISHRVWTNHSDRSQRQTGDGSRRRGLLSRCVDVDSPRGFAVA